MKPMVQRTKSSRTTLEIVAERNEYIYDNFKGGFLAKKRLEMTTGVGWLNRNLNNEKKMDI